MLKMYQASGGNGGSSVFWESVWDKVSLDDAIRFCQLDPLRPLFEKHVHPGDLMLEGGCGLGHYVTYYTARGVQVVGLDFAGETLCKLRKRQPNLTLSRGDVSALPFRDYSFDVYYSGGVVEHFEEGPQRALLEAQRVLKPDGIFLVSVPYLSPLRRLTATLKRTGDRIVSRPRVEHERPGRSFFQYAYTPKEFEPLLRETGFRVISRLGYAILFGVYDVPLLGRATEGWLKRRRNRKDAVGRRTASAETPGNGGDPPGLLKRLLVAEDANLLLLGSAVRALRWACANMMMYVCVREGAADSPSK